MLVKNVHKHYTVNKLFRHLYFNNITYITYIPTLTNFHVSTHKHYTVNKLSRHLYFNNSTYMTYIPTLTNFHVSNHNTSAVFMHYADILRFC